MDIGKRLLRRPVTTVVWIAVLSIASLLIGLGAAIDYAAGQLPTVLDAHHRTVAAQARVLDEGLRLYPQTEEDVAFLEALPMVKAMDFRTLSGAYAPGLTARLGLSDWGAICRRHVDEFSQWGANDSQTTAVLIGTVEAVWTADEYVPFFYDLSAVGGKARMRVRYLCAMLAVDEAVALHPDYPLFETEGYSDYDGRVVVRIPTYIDADDDTADSFFKIGSRYVVQGAYDPSCHGMDGHPDPEVVPLRPHLELRRYPFGSDCIVQGDALVCYRTEEAAYANPNATEPNHRILSLEGRVPVAEAWNGTAEELIASDSDWASIIEMYRLYAHCFPVLGTEAPESMVCFVTNKAQIAEGRSFTPEECETGARVCMLSESVALAAGVKVGDTIEFFQFHAPLGPEQGNSSISNRQEGSDAFEMLNNPSLGCFPFFADAPEEAEPFTVVGLYRLENEWENSAFSITPNTVFVPKKAQIEGAYGGVGRQLGTREIAMYDEQGVLTEHTLVLPVYDPGAMYGVYFSVLLENGSMDAFAEAIAGENAFTESGMRFLTFDQGYEAAREGIEAVQAFARGLLRLAVGLAAVLLLLYLVLYQAAERKTIGIMRSLGARRGTARRYLFASGLILALLGVVIGTLLGGTALSLVQDRLLEWMRPGTLPEENLEAFTRMLAESALPLRHTALLGTAQAAAAAVLLWAEAALLTRDGPSARREV